MNAKKCLYFMVAVSALTVGVVAFQAVNSKGVQIPVHSTENFTFSITPEGTPNDFPDEYQNTYSGVFKTTLNHNVNLSFVNAKVDDPDDPSLITLAPRGMIHNLNTGNNQLTGINGVKFSGTGTLLFRPAVQSGYLPDVDPVTITAGTADFVAVPECDYFELIALPNGSETTISNLSLHYSCDAEETDVKLINGTYSGVGSDSSTYKMSVNDGVGSIESLDKQSNITLNGTAQMLTKSRVKFTFVYNTYNIYYTMDYDGHSLTFVSKTDDVGGSAANQVAQVSLDRVYNVEDFESYTATGTGYVSASAKYTTSNLRANYYADYYTGSSTGEIGGSGWPIMTSTDNSTYNSVKGHNSSKTGIFKFSNGMGMRYISMNSLYGVKQVVGKGSVLSFWARGAYTNTNFNTDHANNTPMKFYAFYGTPLTPSNQTTVRESFDFTVTAGSTWQHFEMPLTEGRTYYGFGFYAKQSSGSTQYVPIDDIQIYTASPYAEYVAPVAVTGVSVAPTALALTTGGHDTLTATIAPNDATNKNVEWSSSNNSIATVDADGTVHAVSAGNATITATTEDGSFTASCAVTITEPASYYPEGTYKGVATVAGNNFDIVLAIGNQANGLVAVRLSNKDAVATGISYNDSTGAVTITTTGNYNSMTYGTITGTYDHANQEITGISCSGTISSYVSNNGSITAKKAVTSSTSSYLECDGTTSQLQSQFKRRYMSGSWQVDTSNANRITSNEDNYVSGSGAAQLKGWTGGAVAFNLGSDFSPAKTLANIHFWVYNPSSKDNIKIRVWVYKAANFGSNAELIEGGFAIAPNGWTYCSVGFTSAGIYNFQLADFTNSGEFLTFDNIYLF